MTVGAPKTLRDEDYELYRNFWQSNLQSIHQISKELERTMIELERRSADFDECYETIESKLTTLHAIYRSYATIDGDEYILKLKALVADHRAQIERQTVSFNVIHFLLDKIRTYESEKIGRFPGAEYAKRKIGYKPIPLTLAENARFKWISFMRNGSWFLARYDRAQILPASSVQTSDALPSSILYEGNEYPVRDLLSASSPEPVTSPACFVIIEHDGVCCFAADRTGRRIIAGGDALSKKIEPFSSENSCARGFVRIAGTRYILLRDIQSSSGPKKNSD